MLRAELRGRNQVINSFIESVRAELIVPLADAQTIYQAHLRRLACIAKWWSKNPVDYCGVWEKWVGPRPVQQLLGRP